LAVPDKAQSAARLARWSANSSIKSSNGSSATTLNGRKSRQTTAETS